MRRARSGAATTRLELARYSRGPSSNRLHSALPAQAVTYPEDVRDVDAAVAQSQEYAQRFDVFPNAVRALRHVARRKLHFVLLHLLGETVEYAFGPPALGNLRISSNGCG